jgi:hypothetical protein
MPTNPFLAALVHGTKVGQGQEARAQGLLPSWYVAPRSLEAGQCASCGCLDLAWTAGLLRCSCCGAWSFMNCVIFSLATDEKLAGRILAGR